MRPYMDKIMPQAWKSASAFSAALRKETEAAGITEQESEFIKVRASQINGCAFCLDLHARQGRQAGIPQQKLDLISAWRETDVFTEREKAMLAVAEAATMVPVSDDSAIELYDAKEVLGEELFVAAEWVAVAINMFNRISILSEHPVRPRDAEGNVIRS